MPNANIEPRKLAAIAFIADDYARTNNPVSGLMPIFGSLLSQMEMKVLEPMTFAHQVRVEYGLQMNPLVVRALCPEMEKSGWLVRHGTSDETYTVQQNKVSPHKVNVEGVEEVLEGFSKHVQNKYSANITQTGQALKTTFLRNMMTESMLSNLGSMRKNASWSKTISAPDPSAPDPSAPDTVEHNDKMLEEHMIQFACCEYTDMLRETDPEKFMTLGKIIRGALIAEAIISIRRPASPDLLQQVTVIIDGPLLLDKLDLSSSEAKRYANDLFDLMNRSKVQKCVFQHSIEEMERTLSTTLAAVRDCSGYGPLALKVSYDPSEMTVAQGMEGNLQSKVEKLGIKIIDSVARFNSEDPFHAEHWGALMAHVCGSMQSPEAKDADNASAILTLRMRESNNSSSSSVVNTKWMFVTKNQKLAKYGNRYFMNHGLLNEKDTPPIFTDLKLAAFLWFCTDMSHGQLEEMLNSKLIATCSAVREPEGGLIPKILHLLRKDPDKQKLLSEIVLEKCVRYFLSSKAMREGVSITSKNVDDYYGGALQAFADNVRAEVDSEKNIAEERLAQESEAARILREQVESGRKELMRAKEKAQAAQQNADAKARESDKLKLEMREREARHWEKFREAAVKAFEKCHAKVAWIIGAAVGLIAAGILFTFFPKVGEIHVPLIWGGVVGLVVGLSTWQVVMRVKWVKLFLYRRFVEKMFRWRVLEIAKDMDISQDNFEIEVIDGRIEIIREKLQTPEHSPPPAKNRESSR